MSELKWLESYAGQTVDELIALEGAYRTDSLVLAFEQALNQKWNGGDGKKLSDEEYVVLATEAMEREVNNGGWLQFFGNTGHFALIIVDVLNRIGCPRTAAIAAQAVKTMDETPITEEEIANGAWDANSRRQHAINECDARYFERPDNIEENLFAFIKSNRAKIAL